MKANRSFVKLVAFFLVLSLITPIAAQAAAPETSEPMASAYLAAYTAYVCAMGSGDLEIWFEVTGTRTIPRIGVLTIRLYESTDNQNWYWVETFLHEDHAGMLKSNSYFCVSHVDYQGIAGRYYKAYVTIWGGNEETGDARYIWTPVERAT